ncbi:antirestriction protein [Trinickia symbiotica]|uniref:Antirestriction protein n=1 Tax=Trinickia symbiotica TaxID=863227 RepID=A0A2T3XMP6_9BURK|nr:antirestriction protein [Trinickia symbiotica]PTB17774.1 antirestriction protein [Trinickia symbiotica]
MSVNHALTDCDNKVQATLVPMLRRMQILPRYFGRYMLVAEAIVYRSLESLCQDYSGGYWDFYELSNGGFYMAPSTTHRLRLQCDGNGFDGEMSADAAGIVACLFAFNALVWKTRDERFERLYYCLREFASDHSEACAISAAID